ncbi:MAG: 2Fe-2S iron-sulfur cluster-binding protein [Candidatus Acidiferrales bacterium]
MTDAEPVYQIALVTRGAETSFPCRASEFILQAALDCGLDLPYSCLQGWCITCAVRLLSGDVDQSRSRRFYAADAEAGFALICTGRPRSDVRMESHQKEAMRGHRIALKLPVPLGS